jgi:PAS domain S-box-containing protein
MLLFGVGLLATGLLVLAGGAAFPAATVFPPPLLAALALLGVAVLYAALLAAERRSRALSHQTLNLNKLTARLENSLAAQSAVNARLHESEARYKGLVMVQGDAIFRRGPDSRLTYANEAFFKLFGLQPERAIGLPFAPELHPDSAAPDFGGFTGRKRETGRSRYDQYVRTAYGWRWIAWEDYAIRDRSGALVEVQSVGRDVTERKALEDALTEARDKAEAANRAKSGFLATMSHEIRTPMNGVLGMARLLGETALAPEQKTYVEAIRQSGEALLSLIEDILDFSKVESGTVTLEEDEVSLPGLVEGIQELLGPRAHAKGIELVAVVAPDVPRIILADGIRLRQILTNLVGNAVKFTDRGGVRVDVRADAGRERRSVRFEIRDTGIGVPHDKRDEIFEEFVQADSSHARRHGGSGLGLAITKRLVKAMGGEIGLDAPAGGGSLFWFAMPVTTIRAGEPEWKPLAGRKIAIVARNAVLREGLTAQVQLAGGEVEALGTAGMPCRLDAILIDAGTQDEPDVPAWPEPGVRSLVLLTPGARNRIDSLRQCGFSGYLVKPIRHATLVSQILSASEPVEASATHPPTLMAPRLPEPPPPLSPPPPASRPKQGLTILLAEDNPVNALLTRELLRRRGHDVCEVTSGEAAVTAMAESDFDLLITDIHMPGLDGIEATRRIRAAEKAAGKRRTPIVALTADVLETGRQACQEAGMDDFLAKPIDPARLDAMLARLIANTSLQIAAA